MRGVTWYSGIFSEYPSFQLTRLMRGVTDHVVGDPEEQKFQLTRLMRGVTHLLIEYLRLYCISTHTPHARRDIADGTLKNYDRISTHTPHARRDEVERTMNENPDKFQLTRLMRGVTGF